MMSCKKQVGGQAVIEGVMMKSSEAYSIAVRKPDNTIEVTKKPFTSLSKKYKFLNLPFLRGVVQLFEMLVIGVKALTWSANVAEDKEDEKLSKKEIGFTFLISIIMTIGLFIVLPYYATKLFVSQNGFIFNLIDGLARILVFFAYLIIISLFKDMKRVFQYHGAEHMSVGCYESGKELTPENCLLYKKEHPRCGTSFLVYVIILSILAFSLVKTDVWYINIGIRILFIPLIAGVSYEILKLSAKFKDNIIFKLMLLPGLWTQKLTTRTPDNKQLEVAIVALKEVI